MRRPLTAILPITLLLAVFAGACGGSPKTPAAASAPADATTTTNPRGALGECLARQGVNLPAGTGAQGPPSSRPAGSIPPGSRPPGAGGAGGPFGSLPPGVSQAQFDAAISACQSALPAQGQGGGAQGGAFGAYASCLRDNGFTLPAGGLAAANRDDPAFVKANEKCGVLAP